MNFRFNATHPHKSPDFEHNNNYKQSADAGDYEAQLVATYSALSGGSGD